MDHQDSDGEALPGRIRPDAVATTPRHATARVRLDGQLLRSLIESRLERGVPELQDRWSQLTGPAGGVDVPAPHRSTMHRWTQGQVPRTSGDLLRLCAILDVDPLCLLRIPERGSELAIERLASAYIHGRWDPPALEFLHDFLGRRVSWPPPAPARDYFGRDWFVHEVEHDAQLDCNRYAAFHITADHPRYSAGPFVYHVAYRHLTLFGKRWLQYGFVIRHGCSVRLCHINGHVDTCELGNLDEPTVMETWFGPSPARFRIASLHPFTLDLREVKGGAGRSVRFPG